MVEKKKSATKRYTLKHAPIKRLQNQLNSANRERKSKYLARF